MKTYEEAKAAAIAAGIPEGDITAEDIRAFGYECLDCMKDYEPKEPAETAVQVKDNKALLAAEAKANGWTKFAEQIFQRLLQLGGKMMVVLMACLLLACAGCKYDEANKTVERTKVAVADLNDGHLAFEERFIVDYETGETARINKVIEDGLQSHYMQVQTMERVPKTMVNGVTTEWTEKQVTKSMISPEIVKVYERRKAELFTQMLTNVADWRRKQAKICLNAANAVAYLEGLKEYFGQKAETAEAAANMSTGFIDFIEKYVVKKGGTNAAVGAVVPTP